jgi:hypothetical protein
MSGNGNRLDITNRMEMKKISQSLYIASTTHNTRSLYKRFVIQVLRTNRRRHTPRKMSYNMRPARYNNIDMSIPDCSTTTEAAPPVFVAEVTAGVAVPAVVGVPLVEPLAELLPGVELDAGATKLPPVTPLGVGPVFAFFAFVLNVSKVSPPLGLVEHFLSICIRLCRCEWYLRVYDSNHTILAVRDLSAVQPNRVCVVDDHSEDLALQPISSNILGIRLTGTFHTEAPESTEMNPELIPPFELHGLLKSACTTE